MPFLHPALERAAAALEPLRGAGARLGAPNPVAALRQIDCSPQAIRESARKLSSGRDVLVTARLQFERGAHRAERRWGGEPAALFRGRADELDAHYRQAAEAAARTAAVGLDLADLLDRLAVQTAEQVTAIGATARAAAEAVLAGDRSTDVVYPVTAACASIARAVATGVSTIVETIPVLEPFGTPVIPG
ncbi:hypothetical protein [Amycolatopsis sp. PS_44_ISF1]|uniref:hypothetical protein n=1 Tax=Amycolatopsis sp. PS_44_ISF1 TaxID=2974917 RepID=UPI0028E05519|nr:hypothetical protein [Amycolatopsis sp. PS_44_ISF1]MDT8910775.1 hypothetical protein [Amycolatopsis sp. PS_44_ISF1]